MSHQFPDALIEQIKANFRLSEYIGRTVALKRQGGEMVGLSPFNKERTPSFCVNDAKAFWVDFSSGKTGDLITWLIETDGLSFVEVVKRLAGEAGIPLPERDARSAGVERRRQQLRDVLQAAQDIFVEDLFGRQGAEARAYLESRGLTPDDWRRFGIGYAIDGNVYLEERLRQGLSIAMEDSMAAGLLVSVDGRRPYGRYRDRIMFPIRDVSGHLISFGARALKPGAKSKYLNGPETEIFDKGRNLYGLDMARKVLAAGPGPLLVSEGYMDVIACLRAGIAGCAPMGTSLTENQLDLMWRYHPEPTICLDGDAAGRRAASKVMDMAIPKIGPGRSLRFVSIVGAKDPDQLLRERGADALRSQLAKATPLATAIFERERTAGPLETPEQRADLRERLRAIVRKIGDRDLSREYGDAFKTMLEGLRRRPAADGSATAAAVGAARALRESLPPATRALAYWVVKDPARAADNIDLIEGGLGHPDVDRMIEHITAWLLVNDPDAERLAQNLQAAGLGPLVAQLGDPRGTLADPDSWRRVWEARAQVQRLDAELQTLKTQLNLPGALDRFRALKDQRDRARAAL